MHSGLWGILGTPPGSNCGYKKNLLALIKAALPVFAGDFECSPAIGDGNGHRDVRLIDFVKSPKVS